MVSPQLAQQLKAAGLIWRPAERDAFALLDRGMDGQVFVLSQAAVMVQLLNGQPTIIFHGSVEWALDSVQLAEAIWLPSETQVREELERRLDADALSIRLQRLPTRYHCSITFDGSGLLFAAPTASDAYGQALLHLLEQ
jgi:hypothetical protein